MDMMIEHSSVRQNPGENFRRVYFNDKAELIVWYQSSQGQKITGLQFSYGDFSHDHVIRWFIGKPVSFNATDEAKFMKSTLLNASGLFQYDSFMRKYPDVLDVIPAHTRVIFEHMLRLLHENKYVHDAVTLD